MKKIKYLIVTLIGLSLGFSSCNKDEIEFVDGPDPDPFNTLEFYSIEYDFSKKEIRNLTSREYKESLENNSDGIVPITLYPYLDQGTMEFTMEKAEKFLDGSEYEVPVPCYENDAWSETQTNTLKTVFGTTTSFNPFNGNVSFTINANPWETTRYSYTLSYSELTVPFEAIFLGNTNGVEYRCSGILTIKVPINCVIKIEETES